tara:strand:- start:1422 stop:2609 length:1188 start_codon:yes stop_codon:yes gene_type:complete
MEDTMIKNMAKTLNVSAEVLQQKAQEVLALQGAAWENAGKSAEDCGILALRVAGRQINTENAALRRAGAENIEGMFVSSPRPKEWGKILYNKMANQLRGADGNAIHALVNSGAIVVFEDNHDGTFSRMAMEEFGGDGTTSELPRHTQRLDENTHFYVVWDKNNPTFPSGDTNFKYGKPRPQDERERTSLFLTTDMKLLTVKAQGNAADIQHPTFVTGTIPVRLGANGTTAYCKPNVSVFTADDSLVEKFPSSPLDMIKGDLPIDLLESVDSLRAYYDEFNGKDGWWDKVIAVPTEVIHIDPRDNGGMVLVCADLDMSSTAPTIDVYVGAEHENLIDFAVGSKCLIVGQTWRTKDDEQRMSVSGWWAYDTIEAMPVTEQTPLFNDEGQDEYGGLYE